MRSSRRRTKHDRLYLDILFDNGAVFFIIFVLVCLLIRPIVPVIPVDANVKLDAEYIITMEWPKGNHSDVDLFVKTPAGVSFYGAKDIPGTSLDRDDRGDFNDTITLEDGTKQVIEENFEHTFIRKKTPGEYAINVLMFRLNPEDPKHTIVKVRVEALNPYRLLYSGEVVLTRNRDEKTAMTFRINDKGEVTDRNTEYEGVLVNLKNAVN